MVTIVDDSIISKQDLMRFFPRPILSDHEMTKTTPNDNKSSVHLHFKERKDWEELAGGCRHIINQALTMLSQPGDAR